MATAKRNKRLSMFEPGTSSSKTRIIQKFLKRNAGPNTNTNNDAKSLRLKNLPNCESCSHKHHEPFAEKFN